VVRCCGDGLIKVKKMRREAESWIGDFLRRRSDGTVLKICELKWQRFNV
jgi:hypothetical protein